MIPEQAVEAAARVMLDKMYDDKTLRVDDEDRDIMRAALEAAAPYMLRTVATAEELDELPAGSVVMGFDDDLDQLVSRKSSSGVWEQAGTDDGWQAAGIIQCHGSVTVLHEPGD